MDGEVLRGRGALVPSVSALTILASSKMTGALTGPWQCAINRYTFWSESFGGSLLQVAENGVDSQDVLARVCASVSQRSGGNRLLATVSHV